MELFETDKNQSKESIKPVPLADRMRPQTLDEFVGQEKIVGKGTPLRKAIESDNVSSLIFWGPPGSGKTTLARLISKSTKGQFVPFSAVSSSIKEIKVVISKADGYFKLSGKRTYIFIDEIHRFNKAQQDAFLPYVEKGDIVLIGATTENPSFEVISALMSRVRIYVLERLSNDSLKEIIESALTDKVRGIGDKKIKIAGDVIEAIAAAADGDARKALTLLELAADFVGDRGEVSHENLKLISQRSFSLYDKSGEEHFNLISALHKTIRGGDPDASLYWLARMLHGGEDPRYIIRRLVRFASEDIGLADPYALTLTLNARDSYLFLGSPEGELAIAEAVVYMACAPKSNSIYTAFSKAMADAEEKGSLPVPLDIRNAPTKLMKALGYGKDYKYAHEYEDAVTDQQYFPDELKGREYFHPKDVGRESRLAEYMSKYKLLRNKLTKEK